jgi:putative transcriptional regulator
MSKNANSRNSSPPSTEDADEAPFDLGAELIEAMQEVVAHAQGKLSLPTRVHRTDLLVDTKAIRKKTGLSQAKFAKRFGFDFRSVQDWEQGRRRPERATQILLAVIERVPDVVENVVEALHIAV